MDNTKYALTQFELHQRLQIHSQLLALILWRNNALLGGYRIYQRSDELQLMHTFVTIFTFMFWRMNAPISQRKTLNFATQCSFWNCERAIVESQWTIFPDCKSVWMFFRIIDLWSFNKVCQPSGLLSTEVLDEEELSHLAQCYCLQIYSAIQLLPNWSILWDRFTTSTFLKKLYRLSPTAQSFFVVNSWQQRWPDIIYLSILQ